MAEQQQAAAAIVRQQPVRRRSSCRRIGAAGRSTSSPNTGRIFMRLKPRASGRRPTRSSSDLRPKLAAIPGIRVFRRSCRSIRIGGSLTKSLYQFTLQAPTCRSSTTGRRRLEARCGRCRASQDVTTDLQITSPQVTVDIDRDKASALGVTRRADRERALQRLRLAPGLDDLHADQPVLGHPGARAAVSARSDRALAALRARAVGQARAARRGRAAHADGRPAHRHAPRPAARR